MNQTLISSLVRRAIQNDYVVAFIISILWQGIMTLIGYIVSRDIDPSASLLSHTHNWDAGWYQIIIEDHYNTNAASAAFYPLFPLLVSLLSTVSFGLIDTLTAALVLNIASLGLGLTALFKIARHFIPVAYRFLPALLLLSMPAALFLHMFYSEALFIALGFWAYAFALQKRWGASCLLLAILSACRLPAVLFIALCFLEFCRAYEWQLRRIFNKKILLFFITPLGFVGYGTYLAAVRGNFFAMFSAYKATTDWAYQTFNPNIFETIARISQQIVLALAGMRPYDHDILVNHLIPLFCLSLLLLSSLYLILIVKNKGIPLGFFGILSFIMFTLNSNIVSAHRYTLTCVCIYIAVSILYLNYKWSRVPILAFILISLLIQLFLIVAFVENRFAG